MKRVTLGDKTFELSIPESEIVKAIQKCADRISVDYADKNPLCVVVLNGAFIFAADLLRTISIPCQIAFTKISSYQGTSSTESVAEQLPLQKTCLDDIS